MVVIPYKFKTKDELRKWLWKYLSDYHLTMVPRPCYARVPSFKAVDVAVARLTDLPAWKAAEAVLVSPDDVTLDARIAAIREGKRLYVPVPGEKRVHRLEGVPADKAEVAANLKEISRFSDVLPLAAAQDAALVVMGALSVDRHGNWLGQGEVFSELPPALTRADRNFGKTPRVALVDDMQIFEDFGYLMEEGDARVDLVVTKTQTLEPQPPQAPGAAKAAAATSP
jgi:5-formyltetrahydrofolate cyclo-ligase